MSFFSFYSYMGALKNVGWRNMNQRSTNFIAETAIAQQPRYPANFLQARLDKNNLHNWKRKRRLWIFPLGRKYLNDFSPEGEKKKHVNINQRWTNGTCHFVHQFWWAVLGKGRAEFQVHGRFSTLAAFCWYGMNELMFCFVLCLWIWQYYPVIEKNRYICQLIYQVSIKFLSKSQWYI